MLLITFVRSRKFCVTIRHLAHHLSAASTPSPCLSTRSPGSTRRVPDATAREAERTAARTAPSLRVTDTAPHAHSPAAAEEARAAEPQTQQNGWPRVLQRASAPQTGARAGRQQHLCMISWGPREGPAGCPLPPTAHIVDVAGPGRLAKPPAAPSAACRASRARPLSARHRHVHAHAHSPAAAEEAERVELAASSKECCQRGRLTTTA